jgi:hypothetical protein
MFSTLNVPAPWSWSSGIAWPALAIVSAIGSDTRRSASGGGGRSPSKATRPAIVNDGWRENDTFVTSSPSTVTSANATWLLPGGTIGGEPEVVTGDAAVLRARIRYCPGGTEANVKRPSASARALRRGSNPGTSSVRVIVRNAGFHPDAVDTIPLMVASVTYCN